MSSRMQGVQSLQLGIERARKRRRIQEILDAQGMNFARLASYAHVSPTAVYKTVSGQIHSSKVLQALRDLGVPEQYLFDPKNYASPAPAPVVKRRIDIRDARRQCSMTIRAQEVLHDLSAGANITTILYGSDQGWG